MIHTTFPQRLALRTPTHHLWSFPAPAIGIREPTYSTVHTVQYIAKLLYAGRRATAQPAGNTSPVLYVQYSTYEHKRVWDLSLQSAHCPPARPSMGASL